MTKGAVDVKPNSSELSYLLYYATTRRSKVQKVGAFLEKKTASDVWRARIGDVQVTLQILASLIEKAPRDLPLYAPYMLKILNLILRSRDITMVESSIPTFDTFCEHHDGASLAADQEYLIQYEQIVGIYASFASTQSPPSKTPISAPVAVRWRNVGLQAIKSVASADALSSVAGRQLNVIVPILLENMWTGDQAFLDVLLHRLKAEEKTEQEKLTRRRSSYSTVRTVDTVDDANAVALSGTAADVDRVAEEDLGLLAIQCLKQLFVANNRSQIYGSSTATLKFIADRVAQNQPVLEGKTGAPYRGWATRIFEMETRWTPVQDRYVLLVTAMDALVRSPLLENNLQQQLVLTTMVDSLLQSDINLIGLSVMDVLLGLIQHVLRILQLGGAAHLQQESVPGAGQESTDTSASQSAAASTELVTTPSNLRRALLARLQSCIGNLATHIYYADQISDMVSTILFRLKPSPMSSVASSTAAIENSDAATSALAEKVDIVEDSHTDGFFSFGTAKLSALESIKKILLVASSRKKMAGGTLQRNRVQVKVWEGTPWLLRDSDGRVRKAYVDALLTWLNQEMTKSDLKALDDSPKSLMRTNRDDSAIGLSKRAVSNASNHREKPSKPDRTNFLQLLHLAIYENALQFVDSEADIVLLHLLLTSLVGKLGVNAVKHGLPMIFRLQEDIQELERPLAKVRIGSLCHGYFWMLAEIFDFEASAVGRAIQSEISRRQSKGFWVARVRIPPLSLENIGMPGSATGNDIPMDKVETESLLPFDDRFQLVKLISLAYEESLLSPPSSPPTSPGRSFSQPILATTSDKPEPQGSLMPEKIKDQMMLEWTKESVIAHAHESTKTVSLSGSRSGTLAHRNFLAVNGNLNGSNSRTHSPAGQHHGRSRPNSTYGLVGGLGSIRKMRKESGPSPSPASESSRASVTRVDQLKRVLSGQQSGLPNSQAGPTHSDASSDSMVSMDFTVSELSFNPGQENVARAASQQGSNDRARSKSRDRVSSIGDPSPLSSNPTGTAEHPDELEEEVPPVPPLPASLAGETTAVQDHAVTHANRTSRSIKRDSKNRGLPSEKTVWGDDNGVVTDLENLLKGIEVGSFSERGNVAKPPY
ncbi:hypothetical protein BP5796_01987 [Coleophoma crateriformis]|uniref:Protein EFR3 n=1 Tax=Coleophoma crateriformis TaxID=565419 RepID=A0A3D8T1Z9_9HELO|nr:hypothetical protein BP5796_01987 [Coleophoma crateriformis]